MEIRINGAVADIQLESEKTIGEILGALDNWLSGTGHRLSGIEIDGKPVNASSLDECFAKEITDVKTINIITSSMPELMAESLFNLLNEIKIFEEINFSEKAHFLAQWKESPEANLLAEQCPDLFNWINLTFSGEGSNTEILRLMAEERLRELQNPAEEMNKAESLVEDICKRLEDLPLDMQTGKDAKAAETINIFSGVAEKIIRIYKILKLQGFQDMPVETCLGEFNDALRNLLTAYEQHDTVLVGDIAEYEISPKLRNIHTAMKSVITGE